MPSAKAKKIRHDLTVGGRPEFEAVIEPFMGGELATAALYVDDEFTFKLQAGDPQPPPALQVHDGNVLPRFSFAKAKGQMLFHYRKTDGRAMSMVEMTFDELEQAVAQYMASK